MEQENFSGESANDILVRDFMSGSDNSLEHTFHNTSDPKCSTCFSETLRLETSQRDYNKYAHEEAFGRNEQIDDPRSNENPLG